MYLVCGKVAEALAKGPEKQEQIQKETRLDERSQEHTQRDRSRHQRGISPREKSMPALAAVTPIIQLEVVVLIPGQHGSRERV